MSRLPVFLDRRQYRRRRAIDALRMLPVIGALLFLAPLLWWSVGAGGFSTALSGLYLFAVWGGLIAAAAAFARGLDRSGINQDPPKEPTNPGDEPER